MSGLLVIDDDRSVVHFIRAACKELELTVHAAEDAEEGLSMLKQHQPDALLIDVMLPDMTGLELLQKVRRLDERVPVIVITAGGESDAAIEAMTLGALDFLLKPLDVERVRHLVKQSLEIRRLMETPVELPPPQGSDNQLIGRSPAMMEVYKAVGRVAPQNVAVLIRGESGTGKEIIARAIYLHGDRRSQPFLAVNCAALPDALLESELFGHEKGSFTGADHRRIGKFEQCNGGTIFLDEVGDMAPLVQAKLLRLLQEQRFERVGGNETIQTNVRIITATNRDLDLMTAEGTFRPDLYYRLNGFTIKLPPLRERGNDLLLLIDNFLAKFSRELGKQLQRVSPDALKILTEYSWPGNVREMQSVLKKALLNMTGPILLSEFLPEEILAAGNEAANPGKSAALLNPGTAGSATQDLAPFLEDRLAKGSESVYAEAIEFMERFVVTRVLQTTGGNQSQAARILGITRGSLRNKTQTLGIKIGQVVTTGEADDLDEES
ncbi:MAG: sigma-54-dependent transcriptional regulator [Pirellulaceae bacterium]